MAVAPIDSNAQLGLKPPIWGRQGGEWTLCRVRAPSPLLRQGLPVHFCLSASLPVLPWTVIWEQMQSREWMEVMPSAHRARVGWRAGLNPQVARTGRERLLSASAHHCPSVSAQINIWPGLDELGFLPAAAFPSAQL